MAKSTSNFLCKPIILALVYQIDPPQTMHMHIQSNKLTALVLVKLIHFRP